MSKSLKCNCFNCVGFVAQPSMEFFACSFRKRIMRWMVDYCPSYLPRLPF